MAPGQRGAPTEPAGDGTSDAPPAARFRTRLVLGLLVLLASAVFATTAYVLTHASDGVPEAASLLFAGFVFAAVLLTFLVGERLWQLWASSRARARGSKLHGRLVLVLSALTVIPAVVAFVLTGAVLQGFAQNFFLERVSAANIAAKSFGNEYFVSQRIRTGEDLLGLYIDADRLAREGRGAGSAPVYFRSWLEGQAAIRGFVGVTLLDAEGRVVQAVTLTDAPFALPPQAALAAGGRPLTGNFDPLDTQTLETYWATLRLPGGGFLIAYRNELPGLREQLLALRDFRDESVAVRERLGELRTVFAIGYTLLLLVLLLGAVWIGLIVASNIVEPVKRLAAAAGLVSAGDLGARVRIRARDDELGDLGRAFNDMTEQLGAQRGDLIEANQRSDARRRFIETVLSSVPSGVLSVRADGRIAFANPCAAAILGADARRLPGLAIGALAPELSPILQRAAGTPEGSLRDQVELDRKGRTRIINVAIVPDPSGEGGEPSGSVVTLDDITELVSAQRNAAWGDVAQRIAHEIKNPLTPIQLSAERLKRRYRRQLPEDDTEVFDKCTETIVRHVGDIGRMVSEFSSFARMPEPVMKREDLRGIAKEALFPVGVAFPGVAFEADLADAPVPALCDGRLISQAVGNLLKNAAEALTEHKVASPKVTIRVRRQDEEALIEVADNGPGLPAGKHRLTEPYMTTREKGTGLGLAIVRKATEDHGGSFSLEDAPGGGALATIALPAAPAPRAAARQPATEDA